jgi:hypothetical protein
MTVRPLAPFSESNFDAGTMPSPEHALAAYTTYLAYFGTYTVDAKKHVVTVHVEGAWRRITPTLTSRVPSNWKATDWRSAIARPGVVCWSVFVDLVCWQLKSQTGKHLRSVVVETLPFQSLLRSCT